MCVCYVDMVRCTHGPDGRMAYVPLCRTRPLARTRMTKLQANDRWTSPCTYTTIPFPLKSPPLLLSGASNFAFRQILSSYSTTPALEHSTAISAFMFADGERNSDDACFLCFLFFFFWGGKGNR